jgi:phosphohistidine swiveling domain-containing protein/tetratricopeptide (TPR) repeat protein
MYDENKVLDTFFGSEAYPVEWKNDEKKRHWFYDDLHCPNAISPLYFDCAGWWGKTCEYMYQRFGFSGGKDWVAKEINGYVYTAVVPRTDEQEIKGLDGYFGTIFSLYADKFLDWWNERYLPEIKRNYEYLDNYVYEGKSLGEIMIFLEEATDIFERHFNIHWILNMAQFLSFLNFNTKYAEIVGHMDNDNAGKILVSTGDRNWDSLRALYEIKEFIKTRPALVQLFKKDDKEIAANAPSVKDGPELVKKVNAYKDEFGYHAIYTHELIYPLWIEDPTPIYAALKTYIESNYDYHESLNKCIDDQKKAIAELKSRIPDPVKWEEMKKAMEPAIKMAPLTPDHHFYIDQGAHARYRLLFKQIGKRFVELGILNSDEDIFMLKYEEIRWLSGNPKFIDAKAVASERRKEMENSKKITPKLWFGTITEWSLHEESYIGLWGWPDVYQNEQTDLNKTAAQTKATAMTITGLAASPGVVEGIARFVTSPDEFNQIQTGDILVCKMTNPAWIVSFSKILGLVTDAGGATSHPAVVSREFGIPCVVGTRKATQVIKSGMKIRVDGSKGIVEILG